ncbi:N-acetylmuramoyl-L-alanine amidase [Thalassotalea atypica]|uniref:N-acetylmuramoyl-L-alanine amidase n=1 Tax=Thalassotalea atypica TaxID=2054316 RepID=UPI00257335D8|nr:N-acetylmuramoyl-L-alanine amidase [Thalassotalea atypica]
MDIKYLVIHTAAYQGRNCDADTIDEWHRNKGWNGIGYHYVILNDKHDSKPDGKIEKGRDDSVNGAHAYGINQMSLGICCIGHGDHEDFTPAQYENLYLLLAKLCHKYQVSTDNIIGHRELNSLVNRGLLGDQYRTAKSCPGHKINMNQIRQTLSKKLLREEPLDEVNNTSMHLNNKAQVIEAINVLKEHKGQFTNARDELIQFLYHPEIIELIAEK